MEKMIQKKLTMIHQLTKVDTYLLNADKEIEMNLISIEYPHLIKKDINLVFSKIVPKPYEKNSVEQVYEFISDLGFRYLYGTIYTEKKEYYGALVLGPIALSNVDFSEFESHIQDNNTEEERIINAFLETLDYYSIDSYKMLSSFIYNTMSNNFKEPKIVSNQIRSNPNTTETSHIAPYYNQYNFSLFLQHNFDVENQILEIVKTGNIDKLKSRTQYLGRNSEFILKKRANINYIRNLKDFCITTNSIYLRAALKGGLPYILGHYLSNKNAVLIEKTNNLMILRNLPGEIMEEYCTYVHEYSNSKYSKLIKNAIDYILSNITLDMSLDRISEHLYINPTYLSRKFKQETGYSITQYINNEKIKLAKYFIEEKKCTLSEISYKVGFNSYTHFAHIFKKNTNLTPKAYKKMIEINKKSLET